MSFASPSSLSSSGPASPTSAGGGNSSTSKRNDDIDHVGPAFNPNSALLDFPRPAQPGCGRALSYCEYESVLLHEETAFPPQVRLLLQTLPQVDPLRQNDKLVATMEHWGQACPETSFYSARNAFLPPRRERQLQVKKALSAWFEQGWLCALEELAMSFDGGDKSSLWSKIVGNAAKSVLAIYRMTSNIHSSFNPHLLMSGEDMVERFTQVRAWQSGAIVRALAWHPHTSKLAVGLKDDTVIVSGSGLSTTPVLKYKQQRGIACMAWKPLNASELAVGGLGGLLIWTLDPSSVAARPSASCVTVLSTPKGHNPVTSVQWDPKGSLLLSSSAADTSMILWNAASETKIPLRRVGGGGVHFVSWSLSGQRLLAATPSRVFRVWEAGKMWTHERWTVLQGHVNSGCWSPCGKVLLFTTNEESIIYALNFDANGSSSAAVPVADLSVVDLEENGANVPIGGLVQSIQWDPLAERLAVSFQASDVVALFGTSVEPYLTVTPIGLIRGLEGEVPSCIAFANKFDEGALLTVAWSSGRIQHIPMLFVPSLRQANLPPLVINPDLESRSRFHQTGIPSNSMVEGSQLFSTPMR